MKATEVTYQPSFPSGLWTTQTALSPWIGEAISVYPLASRFPEFLPGIQESVLSIEISAFDTKLFAKLVDVERNDGHRKLTFESLVDSRVRGSLSITTKKLPNTDVELREASLSFKSSENRAEPLFVVDTIYALLGLGGQISVLDPDAKQQIFLSFNVRLPELSELLQRREMYLALMVIEKAVNTSFDIPEYISGDQMSSIFFASRAIVERQFVWRANNIILPVPANAEMLAWFRTLKRLKPDVPSHKMQFGPTPERKLIFGREISLGDQSVFVEDGIIEDYDQVDADLSSLDGRVVPIRITPESRIGRYVFSNPPTLPPSPWDETIQRLVDLNSTLSRNLIARHLALMSLVMPELPPEQAFALIDPKSIAKLAEEARERRTPVDKYLNELLDQNQAERKHYTNIESLAKIEAAIELLPQEKKTELFRFIVTHLRDKGETRKPYGFTKSKRGFPISKGRALFTSADVARIDSESYEAS